jgi:hypothetical protein
MIAPRRCSIDRPEAAVAFEFKPASSPVPAAAAAVVVVVVRHSKRPLMGSATGRANALGRGASDVDIGARGVE